MSGTLRIVVVRHGQAEPKKGWADDDVDRPLVGRGRRQADRLSRIIGRGKPGRIISSPAVRCVQTVQPLAVRHELKVELSDLLSIAAGPAAMQLCQELVESATADSTIVLCTHREVLVQMVPMLAKLSSRKIGHRPPGAKGGVWILRFSNHKLAKVDYHPPAG